MTRGMSGTPASATSIDDALDVGAIRAEIPALDYGGAHFDGPGGSQTPRRVADAVRDMMLGPVANRGRLTPGELRTDAAVRDCRLAVADLLGVSAETVVAGRSMTALTFDAARALSAQWGPGDEVVVSRLDHDANIRPWIIAARTVGAVVRWIEFDTITGEVNLEAVRAAITSRTRLVAITAASNLIGTIPDLTAISKLAHGVGAIVYVDGVHYAAHEPVDVDAIGADLFTYSPYKLFGPHCGFLVGRAELLESMRPDKIQSSTDVVPERFELGTLPYELLAGTTAAIDFLAGFGGVTGTRRNKVLGCLRKINAHENVLRKLIETELLSLPGVTVHSRASIRTPTLLLTIDGERPQEIGKSLAARGVYAVAGAFYCDEAAEAMRLGRLGGLRIGLAPYNTESDVDRLLEGLRAHVGSA